MVASTDEAVDPDEARTEGFGQDIQRLASYFYADDDLLTSTQVEQLQQAFNTLTELFNQVGLRTNIANTANMDC